MMEVSEITYRELVKSDRKLQALVAGGVDNWDGYDFAMEGIRTEEEIDELVAEKLEEILTVMCEFGEEPAGRGAGFGVLPEGERQVEELLFQLLTGKDKIIRDNKGSF